VKLDALPQLRELSKPKQSRMGISLSTLSASNSKEEDLDEPEEDETSEDFEIVQAIESWKKYAQQLSHSNTLKLHGQALDVSELQKDPDGNLIAIVDSRALMSLISEIQYDLMQFLKSELKIKKLRLSIEIEMREKEFKPYSPEEIYTHLAKLNPAIEELRNKYNLEF